MKLVTGQRALMAIGTARRLADTWYVLDSGSGYPEAREARMAKTYSLLREGPKTGRMMFAELAKEGWCPPDAGSGYTLGEFGEDLRDMVRKKRLHVLLVGRLSPEAALGLRMDLKGALARVATVGGGVASLVHEVERVAKYAAGRDRATLGEAGTTNSMRTLIDVFAGWGLDDTGLRGMDWDTLYEEVTDARNDIAHTGTEAVLARTRTMALATVLMDALHCLAGAAKVRTLKDVMVSGLVFAHRWQTVSDVRRTMLVTDFSELPLSDGGECEGKWKTLTAQRLAAYLAKDRADKLGMTVDDASKEQAGPLKFEHAPTEDQNTPVGEVWEESRGKPKLPLIVTRTGIEGSMAVGIVTSFDLL